jgi:hypothetical protein
MAYSIEETNMDVTKTPASTPVPPEAVPRLRAAAWAALLWSALAGALALGWMAGLLPPPPVTAVHLDSPLQIPPPAVGTALLLGIAALGMVTAAGMLLGADARTARLTRGLAASLAVLVLLLTPGHFLALLGYTLALPVLGWIVPGIGAAYLSALVEPTTLVALFGVAGVLAWTWAAWGHGRGADGGCGDCGRSAQAGAKEEHERRLRALRVGRRAVLVGAVFAFAYPAARLPWAFGVGFGLAELDAETATVGLSLGGAALVGVVLMTGLIVDWGVRFPRWVPGLAGRRVPVGLAILPAVVAVALITTGRSMLAQVLFAAPSLALVEFDDLWWVHGLALAAALPWGIAVAVATAAYLVRRRAQCGTCERGEPEQTPSDLRRHVRRGAAGLTGGPRAGTAR